MVFLINLQVAKMLFTFLAGQTFVRASGSIDFLQTYSQISSKSGKKSNGMLIAIF
jgi:hypothetical protein